MSRLLSIELARVGLFFHWLWGYDEYYLFFRQSFFSRLRSPCFPKRHVGCICLDGYEGEHCEINTKANALTMSDIAVAATSEKSVTMIVVLVTVGVFVTLFFLWYYDRREKKRRRRKRLQNAGIQSSFQSNTRGEMS